LSLNTDVILKAAVIGKIESLDFKKISMVTELTPEEEQQREKWRQEIKDNDAIQQYFSKFRADSIEGFINHYIGRKGRWMKNKDECLKMMNDESVEWIEEAFRHLDNLLQKKLFDLQCHWRAERITIESIKLCCEFQYWESDILNCPFLEPITLEDLNLYIDYLQFPERDLDEDDEAFTHGWQDYEEIKKGKTDNEEAHRNFPEWYDFANMRTGADALLFLPDIRGQKEEAYLEIFQQELADRKNEKPEQKTERDERPYLHSYDDEITTYFVTTFESNEVKEAFKSDVWNYKNSFKRSDLNYYIDTLLAAEEEIPIESNVNWIEGIRKATEQYKRKKIIEALPDAWEQYNMNKEMGIAFPCEKNDRWLIDFYTNRILAARRMKGEPQNLDF
jgi:hypothetical protein